MRSEASEGPEKRDPAERLNVELRPRAAMIFQSGGLIEPALPKRLLKKFEILIPAYFGRPKPCGMRCNHLQVEQPAALIPQRPGGKNQGG